jgi:hypothetical protein
MYTYDTYVLLHTLWLTKSRCIMQVVLHLVDSRMRPCALSEVRWTLDGPNIYASWMDGFGHSEIKLGLDTDLAMFKWILIGQLLFGFGL